MAFDNLYNLMDLNYYGDGINLVGENTTTTTTAAPTTVAPTTVAPTTVAPTTVAPTTVAPTTVAPTTVAPTTVAPTTVAPTTIAPTTVAPTTAAPTTVAPTTIAPTTVAPTTIAPTTVAPTTVAPTTIAPTTVVPTTVSTIAPFKPPIAPEVVGWIGLSIAVVVSALISYGTIMWLRKRNKKYSGAVFVCGLALMFAIMLTFILPIDVFAVSYMKDNKGHFKPWVKDNTIMHIQKVLTYSYFTLYGLLSLFVFGILPFVYFLNGGGGDIEGETSKKKFIKSVVPTLITLSILVVICLCGAFIPTKNNNKNVTIDRNNIFDMINPRFVSVIGFVYSIMVIAGIVTSCFYTAYGLSHTPMLLLRYNRSKNGSESHQLLAEPSPRNGAGGAADHTLRNTNRYNNEYVGNSLVADDQHDILYGNSQDILDRTHVYSRGKLFARNLARFFILYPFKLIFGLIGIFISSLLIISLCVVCIDKWKNSSYSKGYILDIPTISNPADIIITRSQKYFPIDYTIFAMMFATLLIVSLYSIKSVGIRIFLVKLYNVRPGRSNVQALIWFSLLMLIICFSFGSILFNILPTYMTYGHQRFISPNKNELKICDGSAPPNECVETRIAVFLKTFFLEFHFFGSLIFYALNLFLICFLVGIFISFYRVCLARQVDDDFIETDDELLEDEMNEDDILVA